MSRVSVRWLLIAAWFGVLAATFAFGRVTEPFSDLRDGLATETIHSVRVVGQPLSENAVGSAALRIEWRESGLWRTTEVTEVHCADGGIRCARNHGADRPRIPDVETWLRGLQPDVRIDRVDTDTHATGTMFKRWHVSTWLAISGFALSLIGLGFLLAGPEPWRATRWAWFWLAIGFSPFGSLAYLLLSGPLTTRPQAPPTGGRLTGGWAFVLSLFCGGTVTAAWISLLT